jgi:hypothetical protein
VVANAYIPRTWKTKARRTASSRIARSIFYTTDITRHRLGHISKILGNFSYEVVSGSLTLLTPVV